MAGNGSFCTDIYSDVIFSENSCGKCRRKPDGKCRTNHVTAVENTQEQITVNIPVKLKITGNSQQNEIFSFLLKQNDEQSPMPKISKVQLTETKKDAFQIQYEKPGVYRYTISQVSGDGKNWIYDQSEYSLEVYIMRNEQTDTLQSLIVAYNAKRKRKLILFL